MISRPLLVRPLELEPDDFERLAGPDLETVDFFIIIEFQNIAVQDGTLRGIAAGADEILQKEFAILFPSVGQGASTRNHYFRHALIFFL